MPDKEKTKSHEDQAYNDMGLSCMTPVSMLVFTKLRYKVLFQCSMDKFNKVLHLFVCKDLVFHFL